MAALTMSLFNLVGILLLGGWGHVTVVESFSPSWTQQSHPGQIHRHRHISPSSSKIGGIIPPIRYGRHVVKSSTTVTTSSGFDVLVEEKEEETVTTTTTTTQNMGSGDDDNNNRIDDNEESTPLEDSFMTELEKLDTMEVKRRLLDLVPRMMGTTEDFRKVEAYVNKLEERYTPVQTLEFLNMILDGEWQLLFSTNLSGGPKPNFRLRELCQNIQTNDLNGSITNVATWDLANNNNKEESKDSNKDKENRGSGVGFGKFPSSTSAPTSPVVFDSSGTFSAKCTYKINQGARMVVDLDDHVLELAKGSAVPNDVEKLVGLLHRTIPKELFDPNDHAIDTTYLDGDLRIVRMTGPRLEGVRDIFIRRGSMEINPV
jgi:hypothetical protein